MVVVLAAGAPGARCRQPMDTHDATTYKARRNNPINFIKRGPDLPAMVLERKVERDSDGWRRRVSTATKRRQSTISNSVS